jgi:antitoxin (DNA-binding transcriptional repressor) of toxin-antitoxin stability system
MTTIVDIPENQEQLQALLKRIQAGEELLLSQGGIPVARLSPAHPRIPGQDRGNVIIASDFNAPLPDNVLDIG